jgi:hypothetical protein
MISLLMEGNSMPRGCLICLRCSFDFMPRWLKLKPLERIRKCLAEPTTQFELLERTAFRQPEQFPTSSFSPRFLITTLQPLHCRFLHNSRQTLDRRPEVIILSKRVGIAARRLRVEKHFSGLSAPSVNGFVDETMKASLSIFAEMKLNTGSHLK